MSDLLKNNIRIDVEINENYMGFGTFKLKMNVFVNPSYYKIFPNSKIKEALGEFPVIAIEIGKENHEIVHISLLKNFMLTIPYDDEYQEKWDSRNDEIIYFKGLVYTLLCLVLKFLVKKNLIMMDNVIELYAMASIGLKSFNNPLAAQRNLVNYYSSMGFVFNEFSDGRSVVSNIIDKCDIACKNNKCIQGITSKQLNVTYVPISKELVGIKVIGLEKYGKFEMVSHVELDTKYFEKFPNTKLPLIKNKANMYPMELSISYNDKILIINKTSSLFNNGYDSNFYGEWSSRKEETNFFTQFFKVLLCVSLKVLLGYKVITRDQVVYKQFDYTDYIVYGKGMGKSDEEMMEFYYGMGFVDLTQNNSFLSFFGFVEPKSSEYTLKSLKSTVRDILKHCDNSNRYIENKNITKVSMNF